MFAIGDEKKNDNGSDSAVQSFTSWFVRPH